MEIILQTFLLQIVHLLTHVWEPTKRFMCRPFIHNRFAVERHQVLSVEQLRQEEQRLTLIRGSKAPQAPRQVLLLLRARMDKIIHREL